MGKRQFVLKGSWCWDHHNEEIATFTIEGDVAEEGDKESPIYIGKPLNTVTFPQYLDKHRDTILDIVKKFRAMINGNPMSNSLSDGDVVTLYEIAPYPKIAQDALKSIMIKLNPEFLCKIDAKGNMVTG
ncbi:hypothetical protein A2482_02335 [Candidatus Falkowbacteria bacterium RIFOXYC2_FULL_48_21]|uniref:Uncharacterized protein n=1 Tax=Candidatus Falkowbacteria bacterium RIFOXYC2_FULL_48_21 TaxID=1798005 RepID=A0A1F5TGA6_9BACT|nr:MAG: hypothetical protein A2482_02335 [Candidatus Falkowbacteria bacterium RIFOXYC2_FULL_48_21]